MLARLVRGCIALAFAAGVRAVLLQPATALLIPSRAASSRQLHDTGVAARANCVQIAADATGGGPGRPCADDSSPGTRLHRPGLHCWCACSCNQPPPC